MNFLKKLCFLGATVVALLAFAGPASATTLTSLLGSYLFIGTTIRAEAEGHSVFDTSIGKIECGSKIEGYTTTTGGITETEWKEVTEPVEANIFTLNFTGCTTAVVNTLAGGSLTITSNGDGTGSLSSTGASVTVETFGLHCIFGTNKTSLGVLTSSTIPKPGEFTSAKLDISATLPRTGGRSGAFCGFSAPWTARYRVSTPGPLFVD